MIEPENIDVLCTRPSCETSFVTSLDSLLEHNAPCPVCHETWAVHTVNEVGERVHPTEKCPTCGKPGLLGQRCRCHRFCIKCENDHEWHTCEVHKTLTLGSGHVHPPGCSCEVENP